jgi:hypothetical protein
VKSLHSKANSTDGEDKITHFRKKILLYFETALADKLRIGFVQQALRYGKEKPHWKRCKCILHQLPGCSFIDMISILPAWQEADKFEAAEYFP